MTRHLARPFDIKSLNDAGEFSGYGSVFEAVDTYGERVLKGAFSASLEAWKSKGRMPAMLWQHDAHQPIGLWKAMHEDDNGLYVEGALAMKTRDGADAYEHLKAKTVSGLSIGYAIPDGGGAWNKETRTFDLKQVELFEVSPVTFPACDEARIESVKAALASPREMERFLRDAGLSRSDAKGLMARGYAAIAQREADGDEAEEAVEAIRSLTSILKGV